MKRIIVLATICIILVSCKNTDIDKTEKKEDKVVTSSFKDDFLANLDVPEGFIAMNQEQVREKFDLSDEEIEAVLYCVKEKEKIDSVTDSILIIQTEKSYDPSSLEETLNSSDIPYELDISDYDLAGYKVGRILFSINDSVTSEILVKEEASNYITIIGTYDIGGSFEDRVLK